MAIYPHGGYAGGGKPITQLPKLPTGPATGGKKPAKAVPSPKKRRR